VVYEKYSLAKHELPSTPHVYYAAASSITGECPFPKPKHPNSHLAVLLPLHQFFLSLCCHLLSIMSDFRGLRDRHGGCQELGSHECYPWEPVLGSRPHSRWSPRASLFVGSNGRCCSSLAQPFLGRPSAPHSELGAGLRVGPRKRQSTYVVMWCGGGGVTVAGVVLPRASSLSPYRLGAGLCCCQQTLGNSEGWDV
jgi:hypothetical protein